MTEIAERRRGRRGAALTGIPCEAHKWASTARHGGDAYCSRPGGGCSKTRGAKVRTWVVSVKTGTAESASRSNVRKWRQ